MPLTDNSPMPSGILKGRPMIEVSASYLIWLYENNRCNGELRAYIESNLSVLKNELKKNMTKEKLTEMATLKFPLLPKKKRYEHSK